MFTLMKSLTNSLISAVCHPCQEVCGFVSNFVMMRAAVTVKVCDAKVCLNLQSIVMQVLSAAL